MRGRTAGEGQREGHPRGGEGESASSLPAACDPWHPPPTLQFSSCAESQLGGGSSSQLPPAKGLIYSLRLLIEVKKAWFSLSGKGQGVKTHGLRSSGPSELRCLSLPLPKNRAASLGLAVSPRTHSPGSSLDPLVLHLLFGFEPAPTSSPHCSAHILLVKVTRGRDVAELQVSSQASSYCLRSAGHRRSPSSSQHFCGVSGCRPSWFRPLSTLGLLRLPGHPVHLPDLPAPLPSLCSVPTCSPPPPLQPGETA